MEINKMKKETSFYRIIALILLSSFLYVSCMQNVISSVEFQKDTSTSNQTIVNKIAEFKQNGLLDYIYNDSSRAIVVDDNSDIDYENLKYFVENTEECVSAILQEDDGEKSIAVLNAIYDEKTVGEVYDAMEDLSPELATEYENALVNIYNEEINDNARSISNISTLRDIKIKFTHFEDSSRAVDLSKSFNWGTVTGYLAASAGAIAGFLLWKHGGFWTRIGGLVAAGVGVSAMAVIMTVWQKSSDWKIFQNLCTSVYTTVSEYVDIYKNLSDSEKAQKFLEILYEKLKKYIEENPDAATQVDVLLSYIDKNYTKFLNLADAAKSCISYYTSNTYLIPKISSVTVATVVVGVAAYATGFVGMIKGWISSLTNLVPSWLTITSNGFSISLAL